MPRQRKENSLKFKARPGAKQFPVSSRTQLPNKVAVNSPAENLRPLLKQYFGFASFRPLQEEIMRDALAGKDVFAVLPTGGGKSLCFQLPRWRGPGLRWSFPR